MTMRVRVLGGGTRGRRLGLRMGLVVVLVEDAVVNFLELKLELVLVVVEVLSSRLGLWKRSLAVGHPWVAECPATGPGG